MLTHKQLKEHMMFGQEKKAKNTINFNKFFPTNNAFVNVDGAFKDDTDWWVDLTIQTGLKDATQFWISDFNPQESIKQLRAMIELIGEKLDEKSSEIEVDTKASGSGSIFCSAPQYGPDGKSLGINVQTDINIGNPEWLRFSYYSNTYAGNVK